MPQAIHAAPEIFGVARSLVSAVLLGGVAVALFNYPLGGLWAALALGVYAAALWRYPPIGLPVVLALLPLLNFAGWSGWTLLNEFDLLVAVTLAVRLLQPHSRRRGPLFTGGALWAIVLLAASFFASALGGLFPLSAFDQNALTNYYSSFESLRVLKGFAWALALLPMLNDELQDAQRNQQRFVAGMLAGLCAVVAAAIWERVMFVGLLDFSTDLRITATFPELHTGGGDVHAYLVMAMPFVVAWISFRPGALRVAAGAALFALASYALAVTFTRGGYIGYLGAVLVMGTALAINGVRQRSWGARRITVAALLALAGLAVVVPIVAGSFMQTRLTGANADAGTRIRHWERAIDMMDTRLSTMVFGMGLGSFPRNFLMHAREDATATFSYQREGANSFVRLGSGRPLYFGQRVPVEAARNYTLTADVRSSRPQARLGISMCEKSDQNSFRCKDAGWQVQGNGKDWERHEVMFNADQVGSPSGWLHLRRTVFLTFTNAERDAVVDLDNVQLLDEGKRNLIMNGDFSQGGARWVFFADDHLPWHIFNLWVGILFEQGWLGVLAFAAVTVMTLVRLARKVWGGDVFSGALLAAIAGFLLIGLTESLFDGPRVTTVFFLLLFAALRQRLGEDGKRRQITGAH